MSHFPEDPATWIGRSETLHNSVTAAPLLALAATPDQAPAPVEPGHLLPPLWHWLFALPMHRRSEPEPDGRLRRGGFLPPVALPRRRWAGWWVSGRAGVRACVPAGGRFSLGAPIRVGDRITRTSTIESLNDKQGRSGRRAFVSVRHGLRCSGSAEPALLEHRDIGCREAQQPGAAEPPPVPAPAGTAAAEVWQREWVADAVLLFRGSALAFNAHRTHCDRAFVALLHQNAPGAEMATFAIKVRRPTFDGRPFSLNGQREGDTARLWAQNHAGWLTANVIATLKETR